MMNYKRCLSDILKNKYWEYIPKYIESSDDIFRQLLKFSKKHNQPTTGVMYGKPYTTKRVCCMFVENVEETKYRSYGNKNFNYSQTPMFSWDKAPSKLVELREKIQTDHGPIDYALINYYRGNSEHGVGKDYIGWHNDEEALNSSVFSVSLGASRKFQLMPNNSKITIEYTLNSGDMLHMKPGCQTLYKHQIPQMTMKDLLAFVDKNNIDLPEGRKTISNLSQTILDSEILPDRINITFRTFE